MDRYQSLGLAADPFSPAPNLALVRPGLGQRDAAIRLQSLIARRLGLGVVSGAHGLGKTAVRLLTAQTLMNAEGVRLAAFAVGMDSNTDVTFLRTVATAIGAAPVGRTSLDLTTEITNRLGEFDEAGEWPVLLIDDAHLLSSSQLELVRTIAGGEEQRSRATIVLFGEPELEERIARRQALSRRLALRHTLNPLNDDDALALLEHRLTAAGGTAEVFAPEARERLIERAHGNPRELIELAGRCLDEAIAIGATAIDRPIVERVLFGTGRGGRTNQLGLFDLEERQRAISGARGRLDRNAS